MGRVPSQSRENSGNIFLCEVPVPIFSQRQRSKGRPFVSIGNARPFRPLGQGSDSSRADGPGHAIEWPERKRGQVRRTGAGLFCCVPGSFEHQPGGIWSRSRHGGVPWLPQHSMAGMLYKNAGIEGGSKGRLRPHDSAARNGLRNDAMSHTLTAEWRRLTASAFCVLMAVVLSDRNHRKAGGRCGRRVCLLPKGRRLA